MITDCKDFKEKPPASFALCLQSPFNILLEPMLFLGANGQLEKGVGGRGRTNND